MTSLRMLQLVSPALPVGAFSYSEGLEWLIQNAKISEESSLFNWLKAELLRGQIRIEAASQSRIREALQNWQIHSTPKSKIVLTEFNSWLLALRDASEIRMQQIQMGYSLLQLLEELGHPLPDKSKDFCWAIAWCWAGLSLRLTNLEVIEGYLYGWISNQLSASVRLLPLGPTRAQVMLSNLLPLISQQAKELLNKDPKQIWTSDVGATFAQISHAELYSRLFRS